MPGPDDRVQQRAARHRIAAQRRHLQLEQVGAVRDAVGNEGELGDGGVGRAAAASCTAARGRPKKMRCAVSRPSSCARSIEGTSTIRCRMPRLTSSCAASLRQVGRGLPGVVAHALVGAVGKRADDERARGERGTRRGQLRSSARCVISRSVGLRQQARCSLRPRRPRGRPTAAAPAVRPVGTTRQASRRSRVRCPAHSVCVPLQCGMSVITWQLQLAPRSTEPLKPEPGVS